MRKFFAFPSPAGPPAYEKVVSVVILTILLGFVLAAFGNPKQLQANLKVQTPAEVSEFGGFDARIRELTKDGNVVMLFEGFDATSPIQQGLISKFYYRAAYAAFPARVYVADSDVVVPHQPLYSTSPVPLGFKPTLDWAKAHHVKRIIQMQEGPNGTTLAVSPDLSP